MVEHPSEGVSGTVAVPVESCLTDEQMEKSAVRRRDSPAQFSLRSAFLLNQIRGQPKKIIVVAIVN
jgi:hypothetical protein